MNAQFALAVVLGGAASIVSPCTLPLVPPFIGFLAIGAAADTRVRQAAPVLRTVARAALFLLGVLVIFATTANPEWALSTLVWTYKAALIRLSGLFIAVFGVIVLRSEKTVLGRGYSGVLVALPAGLAFGHIAIACCLGRVISAIQMTEASAGRNGLLLMFMIGLGGLLMLIGLAAFWLFKAFVKSDASRDQMRVIGGWIMIVVGVLVISGFWMQWMYDLQRYASSSKTFSIRLEEAILEYFRVAN